jgi:hypothetical protein
MAKRLGGGLLGFGVNPAGEFCTSYNVRMGETRVCARSSHINSSLLSLSLCSLCLSSLCRSLCICISLLSLRERERAESSTSSTTVSWHGMGGMIGDVRSRLLYVGQETRNTTHWGFGLREIWLSV